MLIGLPFGFAFCKVVERGIGLIIAVVGGEELAFAVDKTEACLTEFNVGEVDPDTEIAEIGVLDRVLVCVGRKDIKSAVYMGTGIVAYTESGASDFSFA